ncbi:putative transposase [Salmonella enterica subsp. indica serovar 6,14,25:z10:1,(2),7 str. 1121]|uniref:Putative transposase n=1 Tax=Salmonella enterica subsp. indica serovar 6,14,25:z10:1,(2),7 str. 1121 TaxID=1173950 RepID=V1H4J1_SALER|nr:putative transposase [Salmonella enterica subsp. indica serovar 6,14,25:z10:1,(2),7 str. 1121]
MTKPVSTTKKPRKQHTPEFRHEALKLAERIGVAAAARELSPYESQLHNWRSKQQNQLSSSEREQEMSAEIARLKRQLAERDEELFWPFLSHHDLPCDAAHLAVRGA